VSLLAPINTMRVDIATPGGDHSSIDLGTREFTLADTTAVGVYELEFVDIDGEASGGIKLPVSLVSDSESNIMPAETIRVRGLEEALEAGEVPDEIIGRKEIRVNREFYTWLILAVLLIMGIEWYLYHTRAL
jgi:hypothetical protein